MPDGSGVRPTSPNAAAPRGLDPDHREAAGHDPRSRLRRRTIVSFDRGVVDASSFAAGVPAPVRHRSGPGNRRATDRPGAVRSVQRVQPVERAKSREIGIGGRERHAVFDSERGECGVGNQVATDLVRVDELAEDAVIFGAWLR